VTEVHPSIRLLGALDIHADDRVVLHAQVHKIFVGELDPDAIVDALDYRLDDNIDLMWCALDAQHLVLGARDDAGDHASMTTYHGVFAF
jgi:hypothetical protein